MSEHDEAQQARIEALEARVALFEARQALTDAIDHALEHAHSLRLALDETLAVLVPVLRVHLGCAGVRVHTFDAELVRRDFDFDFCADSGDLDTRTEPLDVAGRDYGHVTVQWARPGTTSPEARGLLLHAFAELLDNFLAGYVHARKKHQVTKRIAEALRHPLLDRGIEAAIDALCEALEIERLLLFFRREDDARDASLRCHLRTRSAGDAVRAEATEAVRTSYSDFLTDVEDTAYASLGFEGSLETVPLLGHRDAQVLGKLVVEGVRGGFDAYDREILDLFADFLRQRIVDFDKEWKHLAATFAPGVVRALLEEEDYVARWLAPREMEVAILYADLSGFSRLSEQVLREPARVGELIHVWGREVVEALFELEGVFDKMVGDCVIAFFGAPFGELTPEVACERAVRAAERIRTITRALSTDPRFPELHGLEDPVGVATGVNFARISVGLFGPDDDYTGFGPGMNNAARLQGLATRDQILCMDHVVAALPGRSFAPFEEANVKNVERPLRFAQLADT